MLDSGSDGGGIMQWAGAVAAVLVTVLGASFYVAPLLSSRPPTPSDLKPGVLGDQQVPARLWQDPFKEAAAARDAAEAAEAGSAKTSSLSLRRQETSGERAVFSLVFKQHQAADQSHDLAFLRSLIIKDATSPGDVLLLPVMVDADPSGEDAEQRLRVRIAVANALSISGYSPVEPRHVGYALVPWYGKECSSKDPQSQIISDATHGSPIAGMKADEDIGQLLVPYEKWEIAYPQGASKPWPTPPFRKVFVLWLAEEMFTDVPLTRLASLIDGALEAKAGSSPSGVTVRVVGPRDSTTLAAMFAETNPPAKAKLHSAQFFAATPTAQIDLLQSDGANDTALAGTSLINGVLLQRTTLTDDVVTSAVVQELSRRGINAKDPIALISEWDSFYGRALPFSFIAQFSALNIQSILRDPSCIPSTIHRYRYLSGVDGELPGDGGSAHIEDAFASSESGSSRSRSTSSDERPEGLDQVDYLRRLADQLVEVDRQLRDSGQRLRAVGILGTDLYDKLLVLRALRDRLPGAIFFTTGIDARYSLAQEWPATHNLICASSFGFRLHRYFQQGIMPFRDSDQTAEFYGTLCAILHDDPSEIGSMLRSPQSLGSPRLYEIGRDGPVELTIDEARRLYPDGVNSETAITTSGTLAVPQTVQPPRYNIPTAPPQLFSLAFIIFMMIVAAIALARALRAPWGTSQLICGLLASTAVVYIISLLQPIEGEPAELFQRTNVWPAELLRLYAAFLSLYFIGIAIAESGRCDKEIVDKFRFSKCRKKRRSTRWRFAVRWFFSTRGIATRLKLWRWLIRGECIRLPRSGADIAGWDGPILQLQVARVWVRYRRAADWKPRAICTIGATLFFALLAQLVCNLLVEPLPPTRGPLAYWSDQIAFDFAILGLIALTFYTVIGVILNAGLVNMVTDPRAYPYYPNGAFDDPPLKAVRIDFRDMTEVLTMQLLVMRTKVAGRAIYYPLIVLVVLLAARAPLFGDWKVSPTLMGIITVCTAMTLAAAWYLKHFVEEARKRCRSKVRQRSARKLEEGEEDQSQVLDRVADFIQDERRGMFSKVLPTMFVFIGTIAVWIVIDFLSQSISL